MAGNTGVLPEQLNRNRVFSILFKVMVDEMVVGIVRKVTRVSRAKVRP